MNEMYYIRWKSKLSGPWPAEEIKEMLADGRLTKHHQVSIDKVIWTPLCESDVFRTSCCAASLISATPTEASIQTTTRIPLSALSGISEEKPQPKLHLAQPPEEPAEERWYYVQDGESVGPVNVEELAQLAEAEKITAQSQICKEGDEKWQLAGDVFPDLAPEQ